MEYEATNSRRTGEFDVKRNGKVTMLISSKNLMFLEGIRAILRQDPSIEIVGEARHLGETIEEALSLHPQVVLLDGVLTDLTTLDAIQRLKEAHEQMRILVLNISETPNSTARFLKDDASIYVSPATRPEQLFHMIHGADSAGRPRYTRAAIARRRQSNRKARRPGRSSFQFEKREKI